MAPVPPGNIPTGLKFDQGREELGTTLGCCSLTYITKVRLRVLKAAFEAVVEALLVAVLEVVFEVILEIFLKLLLMLSLKLSLIV